MLNEKVAAARLIARTLGETEAGTEDVVASSARLIIAIVEGRRATGVSASEGLAALADAARGLEMAVRAQEAFVAAHASLATLRDGLGIEPRAAGCTVTCLPTVTGLRVVPQSA
jgi:hypothetical protein